MTSKEQAEILQEITKILEKNVELTAFQLANVISKEVVFPSIELAEAIYQRLIFAKITDKSRAH